MTTKQQRYMKSLKEKGLMKFVAFIPASKESWLRAKTDKLREEHLRGVKNETRTDDD